MAKSLNDFLATANAPVATAQLSKASEKQKQNNAGGYSFTVSDSQRLVRFLVLGTDKGTYYVSETDLTKQNVTALVDYIKKDEEAFLKTLLDVVENNRAPKNDYALFALALLYKHGTNKAAYRAALPKVARTATHLFAFITYLKGLKGFSTSAQKAVAEWYTNKPVEKAALQMLKYRQRDGMTHGDALRLSHPKGLNPSLAEFALHKKVDADAPQILRDFEKAQAVTKASEAVKLLEVAPALPWEAFPTEVHKDASFWRAQFESGMGQTALVRNVTRFARLGLFDDLKFAGDFAKALKDPEAIAAGRMHPVAYANALFAYTEGVFKNDAFGYSSWYSRRQAPTWLPNPKVAEALEEGFFTAFGNVESSDSRVMLSLDVSGSMGSAATSGLAGLDCRQASALMALVTLRSEDYVTVNGFTSGRGSYGYSRYANSEVANVSGLTELNISGKESISSAIKKVSGLPFGGTDCSLPMRYALVNKQEIDTFVIYTDNETWAGPQHPHEALAAYNDKMGRQARLVVVAMTGTEFTIAEEGNPLMLDVSGFDTATPRIISDFSAGNI